VTLNYDHKQRVGGVEVEPDRFRTRMITVEFYSGYAGTGTVLGTITREVNGNGGAKLFAASVEDRFFSIKVTSSSGGFAIAAIRG